MLFLQLTGYTQNDEKQVKGTVLDTNYVVSFKDHLNARVYLSRKFTNMIISKENNSMRLNYDPNTTLNLGVGATYKGVTLNLAYGFSFLNEEEGRGNTQYLDLQSHIYRSDKIIDLYGQFYSGLYLENTDRYTSDLEKEFYLRPDIRIRLFGINARKVRNAERFSYSAPFVQNEVQKKSAGSLLTGVKAVALFSDADSNYIPFFVENDEYGRSLYKVKSMRSIQAGPTIGYGHTIIVKYIFVTASVNFGLLIGPLKYINLDEEVEREWQINPTVSARFALGYNSPEWYLGLILLQDGTTFRTMDGNALINIGAGNLRFNYVKRFAVKDKIKKKKSRSL